LESLKGEELLQLMQSFLSKGVAACQKGSEWITDKVKASFEEKKVLEEENRKLCKKNKRLKNQSCQLGNWVQTLTDQGTKQQAAIDALRESWRRACGAMRNVALS
jgi:cell shape-determining protein MreC